MIVARRRHGQQRSCRVRKHFGSSAVVELLEARSTVGRRYQLDCCRAIPGWSMTSRS
jgi:hypothetical protein